MGVDGHTAGILPMPHDKALFNQLFIDTDAWVVEYRNDDIDNPFKHRITSTGVFLRDIVDDIVVYEVGSDKCKRMHHLPKEYAPHIEPMDILLKRENVEVFTGQ